MSFLKPISISLSPNTEKDDLFLAFKTALRPWKWKKGSEIQEMEKIFKKYIGIENVFSFNSGRSCLMATIKALELKQGDEILMQAFTCNAAVNPFLWLKVNPVYVDCEKDSFNIDVDDLKNKINNKTKAVVVQHTFGLPAELNEIKKICRERKIFLVEDCAHSLGAEYENKKVGSFGDVSFFSFSRDKIISSVYGGVVATKNKEIAEKIKQYHEEVNCPSNFWIFQQLLHPVIMNLIVLPTYKYFGKYLLVGFQKFHVLSKAVHWREKRGLKPNYFPSKMPNALAVLALNQFKKIDKFNFHRQKIALFYREELKNSKFVLPQNKKQAYLRFSLKHPESHNIIRKAWKENILIGDWYTNTIAPSDTFLKKMNYIENSCPVAEKLSQETFNLPTHINISQQEAKKITEFLKEWN